MTKVVVLGIIALSTMYGIEYSLRIQALGTDFAYLVPDYETDLYLDPNILGETSLLAASWSTETNPVVLRVFTKHFGWAGQYWGSYVYNDIYVDETMNITAKDFWMLDLRGKFWKFLTSEIWNIYNDFQYNYTANYDGAADYDTTLLIQYLPGFHGSTAWSKYLKTITTSCIGFFYYDVDSMNYHATTEYDRWYIPVSIRTGLHYRNVRSYNDFTSFYVRFGGPVTLQEINTLPYSLWTGITGSDIRTGYFFNTLIINAGFAQGFAIFRSGMFVCGIQSSFLAQWAEDPEVLDHMRAMTNSYVLPCAVEYNLGRVALRMGMYVRYYYEDERTWDDRFPIETEKKVRHTFSTGRSLGLSWQITDRFNIDFLYMRNRSVMYYIDAWTRCHICLKYFL